MQAESHSAKPRTPIIGGNDGISSGKSVEQAHRSRYRTLKGTTFFGGAGMEGPYIQDMVKAFEEVLEEATKEEVNMRTAAYLLAVQRVADATAMRGLYP